MGQKVNPYGMRLGIIREARSKWFAEGKQFRDQLVEDLRAHKLIGERHHNAAISDIAIERAANTTTVTITSAKPGIIIGRGGGDVDRLRRELDRIMSGRVRVNVEETRNPETDAQLVAEEVAGQIERRASIRRAMSQAIERTMRAGAEGVRVAVSGRLGGAEIARTERMGPVGRVPLHTLRADVHLGLAEAFTTSGHIGVKVWVCKGEILPPRKDERPAEPQQEPVEEAAAAPAPEADQTAQAAEPLASPEPQAAPVGTDAGEAEAEMVVQQLTVDAEESPPSEVGGPAVADAAEEPSAEQQQAEPPQEDVEATQLGADEASESEPAAQENDGDADTQETEVP